VKIVWHDHLGKRYLLPPIKNWPLKLFSILFSVVFSVNEDLRNWGSRFLLLKSCKIILIPNYPYLGDGHTASWTPDRLQRKRILSVANLRIPKDHHTLMTAFKRIKEWYPEASLTLVGTDYYDAYSESLKKMIADFSIKDVAIVGQTKDVVPFLDSASIGVLTSQSEGLPLSLLEYGLAGLPVVCTDVGECKQVLDRGKAGWVVSPGNSEQLALAIKEAFDEPEKASEFAENLKLRVREHYSKEKVITQIGNVYRSLA
jgi:glycosyltransferase involved in cell wall biosynthesis